MLLESLIHINPSDRKRIGSKKYVKDYVRMCIYIYIYILFKYQHMTQHSYVMSIYYIFLVCQHLRQNLLRWWGSYRAKYMIFLFLTVMGQSSSMRHETNPPHVQSSVENWINARSRKITNRIGDFEKSNLFPAPNLSKMQQKWPLGF